jgi:hypothetical protein
MGFVLSERDHELLLTIAQHRVLTATQLAIRCERNGPATRHRLRILHEQGLIEATSSRLGRGSGRPEKLVSLSANGVTCLKALGLIDADIASEQFTVRGLKHPDHDEVVSEVWTQLTLLARHFSGFETLDLAPPRVRTNQTAPAGGQPSDPKPISGQPDLVPDGVFAIRHQGIGKTLLFFLEVDMGTQPLIGGRGPNRDVRSKILRHQAWFCGGEYRCFSTSDRLFTGFRVLFVAGGASRVASLCQLIRQTPPSNFVWATDDPRMRREGLWGRIWTAGGDLSRAPESILGSLAPVSCPAPTSLVVGQPDAEASSQAHPSGPEGSGDAKGSRRRRKA